MPATPENLRQAQSFLASRSGSGGTEMMKAIRAALDPSDAQDHIRVVCFMTDGEVGNDMQIIAEVQKHPNARVFAFGIGSSVNRFLLDKMAEYGRGEVEYVGLEDDGSAAAKRFHQRVQKPAADRYHGRLERAPRHRRLSEAHPRPVQRQARHPERTLFGRGQRRDPAPRKDGRQGLHRARSRSRYRSRKPATTCWPRCGRAAASTTSRDQEAITQLGLSTT